MSWSSHQMERIEPDLFRPTDTNEHLSFIIFRQNKVMNMIMPSDRSQEDQNITFLMQISHPAQEMSGCGYKISKDRKSHTINLICLSVLPYYRMFSMFNNKSQSQGNHIQWLPGLKITVGHWSFSTHSSQMIAQHYCVPGWSLRTVNGTHASRMSNHS